MLQLRIHNRIGGEVRYYVADSEEGVMLVPDEVRKCVAFICRKTNTGMKVMGTTFFISIPIEGFGKSFVYLVTAKHLIVGIERTSIDQMVHIRINMKDKAPQIVPLPVSRWAFHDDPSVDVAVLTWAPPADLVDYLSIPISVALTHETITKEGIGVGDEVFLTGLFVNHYGTNKNLPIVRIGNIAQMPEEPVYTKDLGLIDAYLVETRSIGGLSGSPVFVNLGGIRRGHIRGGGFQLLGLMHGHWDLPTLDKDIVSEDTVQNEAVNMGIAIVIPVSKILDILYSDEFTEHRNQLESIERSRNAATPDSGLIETPFTEEDFEKG